jgi:hypothetical protein
MFRAKPVPIMLQFKKETEAAYLYFNTENKINGDFTLTNGEIQLQTGCLCVKASALNSTSSYSAFFNQTRS